MACWSHAKHRVGWHAEVDLWLTHHRPMPDHARRLHLGHLLQQRQVLRFFSFGAWVHQDEVGVGRDELVLHRQRSLALGVGGVVQALCGA